MSTEQEAVDVEALVDKEFVALDGCVKQLTRLTPEARLRVMRYLAERFANDLLAEKMLGKPAGVRYGIPL